MLNGFFEKDNLEKFVYGEISIIFAREPNKIVRVFINGFSFTAPAGIIVYQVRTAWKATSVDNGETYFVDSDEPEFRDLNPNWFTGPIGNENGIIIMVKTSTQEWWSFIPADGPALDPEIINGLSGLNQRFQKAKFDSFKKNKKNA